MKEDCMNDCIHANNDKTMCGAECMYENESEEEVIESTDNKKEIVLCESCGKNEASYELHICPYKNDMYGDEETLCNCCDDCYDNCAGDI